MNILGIRMEGIRTMAISFKSRMVPDGPQFETCSIYLAVYNINIYMCECMCVVRKNCDFIYFI